ncbi:MAG: hypothetical protein ACRD3Y_05995 [Bryobacteraceae bacterium]
MKLRYQMFIVNLAILAGFALEYFRGSPRIATAFAGVFLLATANFIFLILLLKAKKAQ